VSVKGVRLERLTWDEAEPVLAAKPVIVVPVGAATKEHGLHLPLETDRLQAEYLTERVLERLPVVALPIVAYGYYPAFAEYPGSINIRLEAFRDTVIDIAKSLARHGPDRVYVLNTGISTIWALEPARQALSKSGVLLEYTDLHRTAREARDGLSTQPDGSHADELETSVMLAIAPERVQLERARPDLEGSRSAGPLTRNPDGPGHYSPTGAWGDPTLATAEKGRALLSALVEAIVQEILDLQCDDYVPDPPRKQYL